MGSLNVPLNRQPRLENFRMRSFYFMGNHPYLWKYSLFIRLKALSMIVQRFRPAYRQAGLKLSQLPVYSVAVMVGFKQGFPHSRSLLRYSLWESRGKVIGNPCVYNYVIMYERGRR
jgi:hypothetical protein